MNLTEKEFFEKNYLIALLGGAVLMKIWSNFENISCHIHKVTFLCTKEASKS